MALSGYTLYHAKEKLKFVGNVYFGQLVEYMPFIVTKILDSWEWWKHFSPIFLYAEHDVRMCSTNRSLEIVLC